MTTDAWLAFALGVAIPSILAIMGGILAVKSLGKGQRLWIWTFAFITFGVLGLVLGVVQQIRITTQQHDAEVAAAEKARQDSNQVSYFRGQLEVLTRILQVFAQNSDPKRLAELMKAVPVPRSSQANPAETLAGPNLAQLADSAKNLARRFRDLQQNFNNRDIGEREQHKSGVFPRDYYEAQKSDLQPIRLEAIALRLQILSRLPEQPVNRNVTMVLDDDMLSGPNPLDEVATYFDRLAQLLQLH